MEVMVPNTHELALVACLGAEGVRKSLIARALLQHSEVHAMVLRYNPLEVKPLKSTRVIYSVSSTKKLGSFIITKTSLPHSPLTLLTTQYTLVALHFLAEVYIITD